MLAPPLPVFDDATIENSIHASEPCIIKQENNEIVIFEKRVNFLIYTCDWSKSNKGSFKKSIQLYW